MVDGFCRCMCAQWLLPNPNPLHLWLIHIYVTRIVYVAVLFILLDIEFPPAASIIAQELLLVEPVLQFFSSSRTHKKPPATLPTRARARALHFSDAVTAFIASTAPAASSELADTTAGIFMRDGKFLYTTRCML